MWYVFHYTLKYDYERRDRYEVMGTHLFACFPRREIIVRLYRVSLVAQMVKKLSAMQETQVQSLGREDPPGEGMATHYSILAWRIPWTEEPGGLHTAHGVSRSQTRLNNWHNISIQWVLFSCRKE